MAGQYRPCLESLPHDIAREVGWPTLASPPSTSPPSTSPSPPPPLASSCPAMNALLARWMQ